MGEQRGLSKCLQRAGHILILLCVILAGSVFFTKDVNAASFSNTQREYINVLSKLMMEGTVTQNMDVYGRSVRVLQEGHASGRQRLITGRRLWRNELISLIQTGPSIMR